MENTKGNPTENPRSDDGSHGGDSSHGGDDDEEEPKPFTILQSVLSVLPFTAEYKIAQAAFEMLDNLQRIKKEKAKANDLMIQAKIGQHEEAMKLMLSETSSGLEYFTALRRKMHAEGKIIRTEIRADLFEELSKGRGRNRLKRTVDAERELHLGHGRMRATPHRAAKAEEPVDERLTLCEWYGFDRTGIALRCRNLPVSVALGDVSSKRLCSYHSKTCLGQHAGKKPAVSFPNAQGLCAKCYRSRVSVQLPDTTMSTAPGVVLASSIVLSLALSRETVAGINADRVLKQKQSKKSQSRSAPLLLKDGSSASGKMRVKGGEGAVKGDGRRSKVVRSFRVVQLHDMWCQLLSSPRGKGLMWGGGVVERRKLLLEVERREDMVQDIAADIFERVLEQKHKASSAKALEFAEQASALMSERNLAMSLVTVRKALMERELQAQLHAKKGKSKFRADRRRGTDHQAALQLTERSKNNLKGRRRHRPHKGKGVTFGDMVSQSTKYMYSGKFGLGLVQAGLGGESVWGLLARVSVASMQTVRRRVLGRKIVVMRNGRMRRKSSILSEKWRGVVVLKNDVAGYLSRNPYRRHYNRKGRRAAEVIQRTFRGYVVRVLRRRLGDMLAEGRRRREINAALLLQSYVRRYFNRQFVRLRRRLYNFVALSIQRVGRSFLCRRFLWRDRAARIVQAFLKKIFFIRCRDSIHLVVELQTMLRRRAAAIIAVQCAVRGRQAYIIVQILKKIKFAKKVAARRIQRGFRGWRTRMRILREYLCEKVQKKVELDDTRHLSYLIYAFVIKRRRRVARWMLLNRQVIYTQKIVRGYLGRVASRGVLALVESLKGWANPQYAQAFMRQLLRNKVFRTVPVKAIGKDRAPLPEYVRPFLPLADRTDIEVSVYGFTAALALWYESTDSPLLESELTAIVTCFRNPATSGINVSTVDAYIHMHTKPCRKHGRQVCAECYFHQDCRDCGCLLFTPDKRPGANPNSVCFKCHHPPSCHRRCPLQLKGRDEDTTLLGILSTVQRPDLSIPRNIGTPFGEILGETQDPGKEKFGKLVEEKRVKTAETKRREKDSTLLQDVAKCKVDALTAMSDSSYWEQKAVSMLDADSDLVLKLHVSRSMVQPVLDLSLTDLIKAIPHIANKSVREYDEGFLHNMPLPVVHRGEIVFTMEGGKVYLNIIGQLVALDKKVNAADPDFLRLVMDHAQIFERHWRKMVRDVREGVLNRKLRTGSTFKTMYESVALPRPALSLQLDRTFRALGFHKKAMGRDIPQVPYAKLKRKPDSTFKGRTRYSSVPLLLPSLTPRGIGGGVGLEGLTATPRGSLEGTIGRSSGRGSSREGRSPVRGKSPGERRGSTSMSASRSRSRSRGRRSVSPDRIQALMTPDLSLKSISFDIGTEDPHSGRKRTPRGGVHPLSLSIPQSGLALPMYTPRSARSAKGSARGPLSARSNSGRPSSSLSPSPSQIKSQKREALMLMSASMRDGVAELRAKEAFESQRGPGRHRWGERARKSEASLIIPTSASEIFATAQLQITAPHTEFSEVIKASGRFICPIPACGCSFNRKELAFEHLAVHEQKKQLGTTVPIIDSKMKYYWPEGASWRDGSHFSDGAPEKIPCPAEGCRLCFPSEESLKTHSRLFHASAIDSPSSLAAGYFTLLGEQYAVPPKVPVVPLPLKWCPRHVLSSGRCAQCLELEGVTGIPRAPFLFFETIEIDFALKRMLDRQIEKVNEVVVKEKAYLAKGNRGTSYSMGRRGAVAQLHEPKLSFSTLGARATHGVFVLEEPNSRSGEVFQGSVISAFLDRKKDCWVAVQVLLTHNRTRAMNVPLPADFNKLLELTEMPPTPTNVSSTSASSIRVVPVAAVQGYFPLRAGKAPSPSDSPLMRRSCVSFAGVSDIQTPKKETFFLRTL